MAIVKTNKIVFIIIFLSILFVLYFQSFYLPLPIARSLCEISDGKRRVYLEQRMGIGYSYSLHGKAHVGIVWAGDKLKYDNGKFFGEKTLFPSDEVTNSGFTKSTCSGSKIIGDMVYTGPVYTTHMGTPNGIYVSQDGGKKFVFRAFPHMEYPPIIIDRDGYLVGVYWNIRSATIKDNGSITVEQTLVLRNKKSGAVEFNKPLIWRVMVSNDAAVTWHLKNYKVLSDIPNHTSAVMEKKKLETDFLRKSPENLKIMGWGKNDKRQQKRGQPLAVPSQ